MSAPCRPCPSNPESKHCNLHYLQFLLWHLTCLCEKMTTLNSNSTTHITSHIILPCSLAIRLKCTCHLSRNSTRMLSSVTHTLHISHKNKLCVCVCLKVFYIHTRHGLQTLQTPNSTIQFHNSIIHSTSYVIRRHTVQMILRQVEQTNYRLVTGHWGRSELVSESQDRIHLA